ncbi:MAG TPA: MoxR family ATPase, partial [Chloroflexota bacterium]|nr:MoxR family ATPase [Chloroflexota bacterium]
ISLGYPARSDEISILDQQQRMADEAAKNGRLINHPLDEIGQVISSDELVEVQQHVKRIYVDRLVMEYIVDLVTATRDHQEVYLGASPRGSSALVRSVQARAALGGREYAIPDDVKALAGPTLAHRLIVSPAARIRNVDTRQIVAEILDTVPVPGAKVAGRL